MIDDPRGSEEEALDEGDERADDVRTPGEGGGGASGEESFTLDPFLEGREDGA